MKTQWPVALVILDGFGYREEKIYNAILHAKTPCFDMLWKRYPHTLLQASGTAVGLPFGCMGNSYVGHQTIGAGRVIMQPVTRINQAIANDLFARDLAFTANLSTLSQSGGTVHVMGLLSDAGVHSHINHLCAYITAVCRYNIKKVILHLFLDGRDSSAHSSLYYLTQLHKCIEKISCKNTEIIIGSIHGRWYAMDRDNNWDRIQESYDALTKPHQFQHKNVQYKNAAQVIRNYHKDGVTDEYIPPTQLYSSTSSAISNGDGIIFFNFRPDRSRQLTQVFIDPVFNKFLRKKLDLVFIISPINYDEIIKNTLIEVLANYGKTVFSIAETEKYAHVTYFFSGNRHKPYATEKQILIPSLKERNYVDNPEMSAQKITQAVMQSLKDHPYDFYLINYANADMVGHSGNFNATIKAIECLDQQLYELYRYLVCTMGGTLYITADHGNAELMFNEAIGEAHTAHTTNPVPFIMAQEGSDQLGKKLPLCQLSEVAPFILGQMGFFIPIEMKK